jgi:hypothetical protein
MKVRCSQLGFNTRFLSLFSIILILLSCQVNASLLISPTRISFESRDRNKEIIVVNTSNEVRSYALSWDEKKQNQFGLYEDLSQSEANAFNIASPYLRFSPRRITLSPGESQRVKLLLRRKADMPIEAFHSHLKFTLIPTSVTAPSDTEQEGISIRMNFFLNYAIPVIIKNHRKLPEVNLISAVYNSEASGESFGSIELTLENLNGTSSHGNFTVYFKPQGGSKFEPVGYDNAVNIFHEVETMTRSIPLVKALSAPNGRFKLVYEGKEEFTNKLSSEIFWDI